MSLRLHPSEELHLHVIWRSFLSRQKQMRWLLVSFVSDISLTLHRLPESLDPSATQILQGHSHPVSLCLSNKERGLLDQVPRRSDRLGGTFTCSRLCCKLFTSWSFSKFCFLLCVSVGTWNKIRPKSQSSVRSPRMRWSSVAVSFVFPYWFSAGTHIPHVTRGHLNYFLNVVGVTRCLAAQEIGPGGEIIWLMKASVDIIHPGTRANISYRAQQMTF